LPSSNSRGHRQEEDRISLLSESRLQTNLHCRRPGKKYYYQRNCCNIREQASCRYVSSGRLIQFQRLLCQNTSMFTKVYSFHR
jgi:hypothetical protein